MKKLLSILIIIAICFSIFTACGPKQRNDLDESIFVDSSISGGEDSQFKDSSTSDSNSSGSSSANKDQSNSSEQENDDCLIFFITEDFEIEVGSIYQLEFEIIGSFTGVDVRYRASNDCVSISYDGMLTAVKEGECEVEISLMDKSDKITTNKTKTRYADIRGQTRQDCRVENNEKGDRGCSFESKNFESIVS
jgi:hypothetical protein